MRKFLVTIGAGLAAVIFLEGWTLADSKSPPNRSPDLVKNQAELDELSDTLRRYRADMVRVTEKPFHVAPKKRANHYEEAPCGPGVGFKPVEPRDPHVGHWIHVLITAGGRDPLLKGTGKYPEGTMILKQKLRDAAGKKTEFYTGMLKRESGYNSKAGDWEFFTADASAKKVLLRGKIESCVNCHTAYPDTDFVSRKYLENKVSSGGGSNSAKLPSEVEK